MRRALALAVVVTACAPTMTPPPSKTDGTPVKASACVDARAALATLNARSLACRVAVAARAAAACPEIAAEARSTAENSLQLLVAERGTVSASKNGRWLIEALPTSGARVFEMTTDGPVLRFRVETQGSVSFEGDRLFAIVDGDLVIADLASGATKRVPEVVSFVREATLLVVVAPHRVRLLDADTLVEKGVATSEKELSTTFGATRVLSSHGALVDRAIVSFDRAAVVAEGDLRGVNEGGDRVLVCTDDKTLAAVDLAEGVVATFPTDGTPCAYSYPAYVDGDAAIAWFGPDQTGTHALVHAVGVGMSMHADFDDKLQPFSPSTWVSATTEGTTLCAVLASDKGRTTECHWRVLTVARGVLGVSRLEGAGTKTSAPIALAPEVPTTIVGEDGRVFDRVSKRTFDVVATVAGYARAAKISANCP